MPSISVKDLCEKIFFSIIYQEEQKILHLLFFYLANNISCRKKQFDLSSRSQGHIDLSALQTTPSFPGSHSFMSHK